MDKVDSWKKHHRFQEKPGWCGPAVIQMLLSKAGIKKSQKEIAKYVYKDWWGTPQQMMFAYLTKFFKEVNFIEDAGFTDIAKHLQKGHLVILDWWDDFDKNEQGGHYSIAAGYDPKSHALTLVDPSNERPGIWTISAEEFKPIWYDTLDVHDKTWVKGWMLWVDPTTSW